MDDENTMLQNIWNQNVSIIEQVASVDSILFYNPYTENIVEIDEDIDLWDKAYVTPIGYFRYKSSMPFIEEEDKDEFEALSYVSFDEKKSAYMVFDKETHLPLCLYMDSIAVYMDYLADSLCAFTIVDGSGVKDDFEFEFSKSDVGNGTEYTDNELKRSIWNLTSIFNCVGNSKANDVTKQYLTNPSFEEGYNQWTINLNGTGWQDIETNTTHAVPNGTHYLGFWRSTLYNADISQQITLPEGKYKISVDVEYSCNNDPGCCWSMAQLYFGDQTGGLVAFDKSRSGNAIWQTFEHTITLHQETTANLGVTLHPSSGGTWGHLDNFRIIKLGDAISDSEKQGDETKSGKYGDTMQRSEWIDATNYKELFNDDVLVSLEMFEDLLNLNVVDCHTLILDLPKVDGNYILSIPSTIDKNSISSIYDSIYIVTGEHSEVTLTTAKLCGSVRSINHTYMKKGQYGVVCDENLDSLSLSVADHISYDGEAMSFFDYTAECRGLKPSTKYYYKAFYVEGDYSNAIYGDVHNFITLSPIALTGDCTQCMDKTAVIECLYENISANTSFGVVLSWDGGERTIKSEDNLNSIKSFALTGLIPSTTYSYRAYVEIGDTTFYGANRTFTTQELDMTGRWAFKYSGSSYIVDFYADGTTSKYDGVNYFRWTVNGRELNLDVKNDFGSSWNSPWTEYRGTFDEDLVSASGNEYNCMFVGTNYDYVERVLGEFTLNKYIASTGNCLEYDLNSATVQCYYENVPEGAECGIILSWDEGVDTISSSSEEATKVFVLNDLTSFKTYTYCAYIKYDGKIYTGGSKTFMPKHPVIPDLSGTWGFDQSFYWVKTVNLVFVKSGDGWVEYEYSEGSSSLTCTVYADQKVMINIYISGGNSSRATFEGVTNETFTSFSGDSYSKSSSNGVNVRVDTVNDPWMFCRP